MDDPIKIFGHKNPDTDSISAAIALSHLKNEQGMATRPYRLGDISQETQFVLDYFGVPVPEMIDNVKIQVRDLNYDVIMPLSPEDSILTAYHHMNMHKIRTLPIVDDSDLLIGIITMKDIAMNAINGDLQKLETTFNNIKRDLKADVLNYAEHHINGYVLITAFHETTLASSHLLGKNAIVITGDRYDVIELAIENQVQLIIVTGGLQIPEYLTEKAAVSRVNLIRTPFDTYHTSKLINQTNIISTIMKSDHLITFRDNEYMDNCKEIIQASKHSKFPIIDTTGRYLGIIGRTHFLNPSKKQVIIVDHNEYQQSAEGLNEADVIEVIDHHKIGDISTSMPISFRNMPVGSTNTIIYRMYQEANVRIPNEIAGLMLSGIVSDTLFLKSPTATSFDDQAIRALSEQLGLETDKYAMEMFKKGTSLQGKKPEEIVYSDFKEFVVEGYKVGISQVFTLAFEELMAQEAEIIHCIQRVKKEKGHFMTLMLVTDIIQEGSYVFFASSHENFLSLAFDQEIAQGTFIESCVSRKKQVLPKIIAAFNLIK